MRRSNKTNYYLIQFEDGQTISEKCRESFGGFNNMTQRIADRFGADRCKPPHPSEGDDAPWTVAGKPFKFVQVTKEGMIVG